MIKGFRSPHLKTVLIAWITLAAAHVAVADGLLPVGRVAGDQRSQFSPAVAYDGEGTYLLVWQQGLNYFEQKAADIYAVRIRNDGTVLDERPLAICTAPDSQERPRVAFSNGRFLIVWQDLRNGRDWDVYGAHVTSGGEVVEANGFAIADGPHSQAMPALAPASGGFLAVWQDFTNGRFYRLYAAHLDLATGIQNRGPLYLPDREKIQWSGYTPGWGFERHPLAQDYQDSDTAHGGEPSVAQSPGGGWLLSWIDETNWAPGGEGGISRRFGFLPGNRNGRWQLSDIERSPSAWLGKSGGRLVTGAENVLFVGWSNAGRHLYAAGALYQGNSADASTNLNEEPSFNRSGWNTEKMILFNHPRHAVGPSPSAVATRRGYLVTTVSPARRPGEPFRVIGIRIDARGKRLDSLNRPLVLARSLEPIATPVVAASDSEFLVAFERETEQERQIWFSIVAGL